MSDAPSWVPPERSNFYVLSLKWSPVDGKLLWWGPDDCGYVTDLKKAGVYSAAQVAADPDYYDNRKDTLAVPCGAAEGAAEARLLVAGTRSAVLAMKRAASRARVKRRLSEGTHDGSSPQNNDGPQ